MSEKGMKGKVLTFGEIMLRLQPPNGLKFLQTSYYEACFGGGEANVAVSLAQFGESTAFFTKLPNNDIGEKCIRDLKSFGVDTSLILRGGERMGIYFCEKGTAMRPSKIIYDRKGASVNSINESELNADNLLNGVSWFHFTGITPALSKNALTALLSILKVAKKKNITVSCDLNYRKKLWTTKEAQAVMTPLMEFVSVLISNEEDTKMCLGLEAEGADADKGVLSLDGYKNLGETLFKLFPSLNTIAFTLRGSISATVNTWRGMVLARGGKCALSQEYRIEPITDRIGGGDSFVAGLIYALKNGESPEFSAEFATASSAIKHTIHGDFNITSVAEVEELIKNGGSGRVQR